MGLACGPRQTISAGRGFTPERLPFRAQLVCVARAAVAGRVRWTSDDRSLSDDGSGCHSLSRIRSLLEDLPQGHGRVLSRGFVAWQSRWRTEPSFAIDGGGGAANSG